MSRLTLILGGARSGKSSYAVRLAKGKGQSVTFLATAQPLDAEMQARIQKHKEERPANWETLEIPLQIVAAIPQIRSELVILDCLTLWVSNLLMEYVTDERVDEASFFQGLQRETEALLQAIRRSEQEWLVVSNEVGLGLVPVYPIGRVYRDALGWVNQQFAAEADEVLWMVAGIAVKVK